MKVIRKQCVFEVFETYELTVDSKFVEEVNNYLGERLIDFPKRITDEEIAEIMDDRDYDEEENYLTSQRATHLFYNASVAELVKRFVREKMANYEPFYVDYGNLLYEEYGSDDKN